MRETRIIYLYPVKNSFNVTKIKNIAIYKKYDMIILGCNVKYLHILR